MAAKKKSSKKKATKKKASKRKSATKRGSPKQPVIVDLKEPANLAATAPSGSKLRTELRAYKNYINEQAGRKIVGFASEAHNTYLLRRPSGITDLDIASGGGLPAGGPVQIAGPEAAGKTYLVMQYMKMHQLLYGEASSLLYVCTETAGFDFKLAAKMRLKVGLPRDYIPEVQLIRARRSQELLTEQELTVLMEKVGELMILQAHTGEEALSGVLTAMEQRIFGIIVIDSLTNLMPTANSDRELDEENKRAAHASMMTDFVKHYTPLINRFGTPNYTTLIGVAQARARQNKTEYDKEWDIPIAWAWKHGVLQNILIWNGAQIRKTRHKIPGTVGKSVHWSIAKGKAGTHEHIKGEYDFFFDDVFPDLELPHGADRITTLTSAGLQSGTIIERGGKLNLLRAATSEPWAELPSLPQLKVALGLDFNMELALRDEVMAARGIECRYR